MLEAYDVIASNLKSFVIFGPQSGQIEGLFVGLVRLTTGNNADTLDIERILGKL
jgi:hypothetical protein